MTYDRNHPNILRIVVAVYMVVYHLQQVLTGSPFLHRFFTHGWLGTDFFILVSGFGIDQGFRSKLRSGSVSHFGFLQSRYARIWPRYVCALALFAVVMNIALVFGARSLHSPPASAWFKEAMMLNGTGLDQEPRWWNGPMWTVNALMICYWIYPWLLRIPQGALALPVVVAVVVHPGFLKYDNLQWGIIRVVPLFLFGVAISGRFRAQLAPVWSGRLAGSSFALYLTHFLVVVLVAARVQASALTSSQTAIWVAVLVSVCLLVAELFEGGFRLVEASLLHLWRMLSVGLSPALRLAGTRPAGLTKSTSALLSRI